MYSRTRCAGSEVNYNYNFLNINKHKDTQTLFKEIFEDGTRSTSSFPSPSNCTVCELEALTLVASRDEVMFLDQLGTPPRDKGSLKKVFDFAR